MNTNDETRSLDELVHAGEVVSLTTVAPDGGLTSRPLTVAEAHGGVLTFLVDRTAHWAASLVDGARVNVASSGGAHNTWASVSGHVAVSADRSTIERLWSPAAGAFFDGADDDRIAALQVSMDSGEYWSAPGGGPVGRLVALLGAAFGRQEPAGSQGEISRD